MQKNGFALYNKVRMCLFNKSQKQTKTVGIITKRPPVKLVLMQKRCTLAVAQMHVRCTLPRARLTKQA